MSKYFEINRVNPRMCASQTDYQINWRQPKMQRILQERKENIYLSNRREEVSSRVKQNRKTIIKNHDLKMLELIRKSENECNQEVVDQLIEYANREESNAILQLGNLVIDNGLLASYIGEKIDPLSNDSWWWLIRTLAVNGYINQPLFSQLIAKLVKKNSSNASLANVLETFAQLTNKTELCTLLLLSEEAIQKVSSFMESTLEELFKPAFKIFLNLVANNEPQTQRLIDVVGKNRISDIMKIGLLKLDLDVRLDTCQILTNMCLNNLITENIIPLIMNRSQTDRPKVIKELSYYVANVGKYATLEQLSQFFKENRIVDTLFIYVSSENPTLNENCISFVQSVLMRLQSSNIEENMWNFIHLLQNNSILPAIGNYLDVSGDSMEIVRAILEYSPPIQN